MQPRCCERPELTTETKPAIKVLLADDHPIVMSGCQASLSSLGIDTIGQAKTPTDAVRMYAELKPDVLVLDVKFGQAQTGFDAAKDILKADAAAKIVFWSQCDQDSVIKEAYRIGGHAYVTKVADPSELAAAITKAHEGHMYFHPTIAERLASLSVRGDKSPQVVLDDRELEVFKLMAQGMTNMEIATQLHLAPRTISTISQTIKDKLGVHRPADITLMAVRHAIIEA